MHTMFTFRVHDGGLWRVFAGLISHFFLMFYTCQCCVFESNKFEECSRSATPSLNARTEVTRSLYPLRPPTEFVDLVVRVQLDSTCRAPVMEI